MKISNKKAVSVIEYVVLLVIILGAFLVMKTYIQRGMYGQWGQSGQAFAFGRQFDSQKSVDCSFDEISNLWYDHNCLESLSQQECYGGNVTCEEGIITGGSCSASSCNQLNP
jgi:hypothetical protein